MVPSRIFAPLLGIAGQRDHRGTTRKRSQTERFTLYSNGQRIENLEPSTSTALWKSNIDLCGGGSSELASGQHCQPRISI